MPDKRERRTPEIHNEGPAPKEWKDKVLEAANAVGLDLTDPDNKEWFERISKMGFSEATLKVFQAMQDEDQLE